jgi:hypothetical protein
MALPRLAYVSQKKKQQILQFKSVNYSEQYSEGEFAETENLSSRLFPVLSQRMGRKTFGSYADPTAIYARGKLCVVDGTSFLYDGSSVGQVTAGEKQFATINTKIVIMPDKKYYDTATGVFGSLEASYTANSNTAVFTNDAVYGGTLTFSNPAPGLLSNFKYLDTVTISGCTTTPGNNKTVIIRGITDTSILVDPNIFTAQAHELGTVMMARNVPDLDFICESNNRIWGTAGNTLFSSALGDPMNFYHNDGLSTDSWAVTVGSEGAFTACVAYGGAVLCFKENLLHKLVGNMPANYELYTYTVPGVQAGSEKSPVVINEVLYYKGLSGVYAYAGDIPQLISLHFGTRVFERAHGGTDGSLYYISMGGVDGLWGLWVYDTLRGIWLREDDTRAEDFAFLDGKLHYLDYVTDRVISVGEDDSEEGRFDWAAELCPFTEKVHERKCYSRLYVRMEIAEGAWVSLLISEDGQPWRRVWTSHDAHAPTATAYIKPGRCDSFRVKLEGRGRVIVRSLVREFDLGSEV